MCKGKSEPGKGLGGGEGEAVWSGNLRRQHLNK